MKKQYTKKQITEAIAYWQKKLNESDNSYIDSFACYAHIVDQAYATGDEDWLYVANDIKSLASGLFPSYEGTISYNKMTAELHSNAIVRLVDAMRKDSISKRGAVYATLELDDGETQDVELNFYETEQIDFGHIIVC